MRLGRAINVQSLFLHAKRNYSNAHGSLISMIVQSTELGNTKEFDFFYSSNRKNYIISFSMKRAALTEPDFEIPVEAQ